MVIRPAAFLDRDGTIITEEVSLSDPRGVTLIPGVIEALHELRDVGLALVVVTNQGGIARGLYSFDDYHAVMARISEVLDEEGVSFDATYFCPHHPDVTGLCACRKPGIDMYVEAGTDLGLDLRASYYIGDKESDVEPASKLGGRGILVRTGHGREYEVKPPVGTWVVDDLLAGAQRIRDEVGR